MTPTRHLGRLYDSILARVRRYRFLLQSARKNDGTQLAIYVPMIVIELDNLILQALRAYTLSCLMRAKTRSSIKVSCSVSAQSTEGAAALVLAYFEPTRFSRLRSPVKIARNNEFKTRSPLDIRTFLQHVQVSQVTQFDTAVALNADVFSSIRPTRIFFAHRNEDTLSELKRYVQRIGLPPCRHGLDYVLSQKTGAGAPIIDMWLAETEFFFDLATA